MLAWPSRNTRVTATVSGMIWSGHQSRVVLAPAVVLLFHFLPARDLQDHAVAGDVVLHADVERLAGRAEHAAERSPDLAKLLNDPDSKIRDAARAFFRDYETAP
ncbi:MAG TPA: hypothetical protein VHM19_14855 [Polyangiales bacterium]|jgi:hypothetical protein|nr:hypothetical protein [Polyangiales bacterium]